MENNFFKSDKTSAPLTAMDVHNFLLKNSPEYRSQDYFSQKDALLEEAQKTKKLRKTDPIAAMVQGAEESNLPIDNLLGEATSFLLGNNIPETVVGASLGLGLGRLAQKGIGRVVTNIVQPQSYDLISKKEFIENAGGWRAALKAVIEDEPLWAPHNMQKQINNDIGNWYNADQIQEEFEFLQKRDTPYRLQFGLKPRYAEKYYDINPDGSLSLKVGAENKKLDYSINDNPMVNELREAEILHDGYTRNSVMGDYDHKIGSTKTGMAYIDYYDKWDFGLNPNESLIAKRGNGELNLKETGINLLRSLMDKITNDVEIKGRITY